MENFELPDNLPDLHDVCAELWLKIADDRKNKDLVARYNTAAAKVNELSKGKAMILINSKTDVLKLEDKKIVAVPDVEKAPKEGSIISQIIDLHKSGKSNKEIIEMGYNKSTVNRQVSEFKKKQNDTK